MTKSVFDQYFTIVQARDLFHQSNGGNKQTSDRLFNNAFTWLMAAYMQAGFAPEGQVHYVLSADEVDAIKKIAKQKKRDVEITAEAEQIFNPCYSRYYVDLFYSPVFCLVYFQLL